MVVVIVPTVEKKNRCEKDGRAKNNEKSSIHAKLGKHKSHILRCSRMENYATNDAERSTVATNEINATNCLNCV